MDKQIQTKLLNAALVFITFAGCLVMLNYFQDTVFGRIPEKFDASTTIVFNTDTLNKYQVKPDSLLNAIDKFQMKLDKIESIEAERFKVLSWALGSIFTIIIAITVFNFLNASAAAKEKVGEELDRRFFAFEKKYEELVSSTKDLQEQVKASSSLPSEIRQQSNSDPIP